MSATRLLGQFLGGNTPAAGPAKGRQSDLMQMMQHQLGEGGLERLLGTGTAATGNSGSPVAGMLSGSVGKAAVAGGLLGVLLKGGKKPKKMMKSAAKMGGLGLVAGLAWRAYQQHQQSAAVGGGVAAPALSAPEAYAAPDGSAFLPADEGQRQYQSRAILRAMIAAAKADGHVDDAERERLYQAIDTLDLEAEDKAFIFDELRAPLDMEAIAREAASPEMASELYVASLLMADETDAQERAYLDSLAASLSLDPALARQIEAEVRAVAA
ncbi:tellurite resistance TerB family protein [Erythrobacter sp.]|uniref:tellurite resistance TerB family protein n=1 Tax=Erythrobacter sp. TaxID=1042 RepID=UPI001B22D3CC|nr:tellurite resistance TerB family protein [Erythrobacter sp.]MBO6528287.1 tellurite resistance TerB family protein [Erythrobacter sp.]MBO6531367.1 tellurite resistance TerB family protein [Erythrobacter sp.]